MKAQYCNRSSYKLILTLCRGAGAMRGGVRPVHPSPVGDVPRVGGPPPRHAQLLHQLHHLLLRLRPLQKSPFQGDCSFTVIDEIVHKTKGTPKKVCYSLLKFI